MASSHGGKRKGAGRPPSPPGTVRVMVSYRLPEYIVDWLKAHPESSTALVEEALIEKHRIKAPRKEHKKWPKIAYQ